jgi:Tfp pilus assembly protein PilN
MSAPNQLSFLPDDYLARKAQRRTNIFCGVLFTVVMTAIGVTFSITEKKVHEVERQHDTVETQYAEAAKRIEQVQQLQAKQRQMAHQAELTSSLLEKVPRSFVLAEITNALPAGVSLVDFAMDSKVHQAPAPPPKPTFETRPTGPGQPPKAEPVMEAKTYDVTMKLTGLANTDVQVAQFISKLNGSPLFRDVNLVVTEVYQLPNNAGIQTNEAVMRRFQIELSMNPNADVQLKDQPKTAAVELGK